MEGEEEGELPVTFPTEERPQITQSWGYMIEMLSPFPKHMFKKTNQRPGLGREGKEGEGREKGNREAVPRRIQM